MITDQQIEACAASMWNRKCSPHLTWDKIPASWKPFYLDQARVAASVISYFCINPNKKGLES